MLIEGESPLQGRTYDLARYSEAFLLFKAQAVGLPIVLVLAVFVVMNFVYALAAYPAGVLSDRIDRTTVLDCGDARPGRS